MTNNQTTPPAAGRPVRITSISFNNLSLEQITNAVDAAGDAGADLIALPETCRGNDIEPLAGPTITTLSHLARRHQAYIVCPIYRDLDGQRINTAVLLDRQGEVACLYDKIYPYWSEFELTPTTEIGSRAVVHQCDFGRVGLAICFDVNFPAVWQRLADQGAEVVIWPSAYSAGRSLQAHAINHHYYIVTATLTRDCLVYDITGEQLIYECSDNLNITRVSLDLDRGIYHENFNIDRRDALLREHSADVAQEQWLTLEQWFVLRACRPGVSARRLARQYGLEELRDYLSRSRRQIDERRGQPFTTA